MIRMKNLRTPAETREEIAPRPAIPAPQFSVGFLKFSYILNPRRAQTMHFDLHVLKHLPAKMK